MCSLMKNMETVEVMLRDVAPTFKPGKIRNSIQKALRKYFYLLQNSILMVFQKFEKEKNYIASQKHIMSVADRSKVYNHQESKKNSSKAFLKSSLSIMRKSIKKSRECYFSSCKIVRDVGLEILLVCESLICWNFVNGF